MGSVAMDGAAAAGEIEADLRVRVAALGEKLEGEPTLATILVGDDPSSNIYVDMKGRACARVGLGTRRIELDGWTTTEALLAAIGGLNADPSVFGILLQHPVPPHIDERACFYRVAAEKDVDGVTAAGFGRMALGARAFGSATPGGIMRLLARYGVSVAGRRPS